MPTNPDYSNKTSVPFPDPRVEEREAYRRAVLTPEVGILRAEIRDELTPKMQAWRVDVELAATDEEDLAQPMEEFLDGILGCLEEHEVPATVEGFYEPGDVNVAVYVRAEDAVGAVYEGLTVIRSAVHGAHGNTENWPVGDKIELMPVTPNRWTVEYYAINATRLGVHRVRDSNETTARRRVRNRRADAETPVEA